jgi:DNA-binding ferritin-like protein
MDAELKDFIALSIESLKVELSRLSATVDNTARSVREIEIKSMTRTSELQKDVENIRSEMSEVKQAVKSLNDSQKFKWKTLSEEREDERKEQAKKDEEQAVINQSMRTVNKLLWIILGVLLSIGAPFVWSLIVNGGVKGLVVP